MQYLCDVLGDWNQPKRVGWFRSFLTSIWCQISPATNINIFLRDRPCLCWFNFGWLFGKTHCSSSDLEWLWIFDRNHPVWQYISKTNHYSENFAFQLFITLQKFIPWNLLTSQLASYFLKVANFSTISIVFSVYEQKIFDLTYKLARTATAAQWILYGSYLFVLNQSFVTYLSLYIICMMTVGIHLSVILKEKNYVTYLLRCYCHFIPP